LLANFRLVPGDLPLNRILLLGTAISVVLWSLALADRLQLLRSEAEEARAARRQAESDRRHASRRSQSNARWNSVAERGRIARTEGAGRARGHRQAILNAVIRAVNQQLDPEATIRAAADAITRYARWPHGIILPTDDRTRWQVIARTREQAGPGPVLPIVQGIVGRVFATARTQWVADVQADPEYVMAFPKPAANSPCRCAAGSRCYAQLRDINRRPSPDDIALAESLADALALCWKTRLFERTARN
jgi:hypothetical protein